uniref:Uncharacterized protein n=1 Tax=Arundo donax TaxID=35708 RepID=A0A0A9CJL2_ARUDO
MTSGRGRDRNMSCVGDRGICSR